MSLKGATSLQSRLWTLLGLFALVIGGGTAGYHFLEGWPWLDSLYMTVITVTTVGFDEVGPVDPAGKWFTIFVILLGVGSFTYAFGSIVDYMVAGSLRNFWQRRRMERMLEHMKDHYIICGFGRVGYQIAKELQMARKIFLVVELDEKKAKQAMEMGFCVVLGNATEDKVLENAGVGRARGLLATLEVDSDNLMLILSARTLNKKLFIAARSNQEATEEKMLRAGADRVISPYSIGARRMAQMAISPNVVDFLDVVMANAELELLMEALTIMPKASLEGSSIISARIRENTGANVLGLRQAKGDLLVSPSANVRFEAGDVLIALGTREQIKQLEKLTQP